MLRIVYNSFRGRGPLLARHFGSTYYIYRRHMQNPLGMVLPLPLTVFC